MCVRPYSPAGRATARVWWLLGHTGQGSLWQLTHDGTVVMN